MTGNVEMDIRTMTGTALGFRQWDVNGSELVRSIKSYPSRYLALSVQE